MPSGRRSRGRRGPQAKYQWLQRQNAAATTITGGNGSVIDLLEGFENKPVWMTIVRMILTLMVKSTTAGQLVQWAHGVVLITVDAFNAAAIPEPELDKQKWYVNDGGLYVTDSDAGPQWFQKNYDIRSSRAIRAADTNLTHTMDNVSTNTLQYQLISNCLVRLG